MKKEKSKRQIEDLKLAKEFKLGSERAFSKLYNKHKEGINFYFLKSTGNNIALSQDLSIELFAKVSEKIHLYNDNYAFSTWLYKMAKNYFIDYIRAKKIEIVSLDTLYVDDDGKNTSFQVKSDSLNPESIIVKKERMNELFVLFDCIKNENTRKIAKMRYFEDMSYEEIEKMTGKPMGSVKAILFRARKEIQQKAKKHKIDAAPVKI